MVWVDTKGDWSQRKQRRGQMFKDQHGRRYHAEIEIKTGEPCGLIEPQFTAPLAVPSMYLERSKDPERPYDLHINYKRWKADIRTARKEWEDLGRQTSVKLYHDKFDPRSAFTSEVLDWIGPAPQAIEPIIAAEQGNSWILGRPGAKPDPRLLKYFTPEQLDPERRFDEPDFSDTFDAFAGDDTLDLEEEVDPDATGGKRVPVQKSPSPEAVRKRLAREKKKREREEAAAAQ